MTTTPVFTRYLYLKDDVEISLLSSLLHKQREKAMFWGYELYHSGFIDDVLVVLWRAYYECYAMLNPTFESYMKKKQNELKEREDGIEYFVGLYIHNIITRKFNLDVFMLREISMHLEIDEDDAKLTLEERFEGNKYQAIVHIICEECISLEECQEMAKKATQYFKKKGVKNLKLLQNLECDGIQPAVILVSRIMHYFTILTKETNKIKMGKNIYLVLEPDEIVKYRTIETDYPNENGENVLKRTAIYSSNEHNYLSLFKSDHPENIWKHYHSNWIYYAGLYTQLWNERILEYGGHIDEDEQKVHWENEDFEEIFYNLYGYNPEEQPTEIQQNNIPIMKDRNQVTWRWFYEKHMNQRLYIPDDDFLDALE